MEDKRKNFSPLFIGAHVSTIYYHVPSAPRSIFQSPLHRGTRFNHVPLTALRAVLRLFQSPLHRGTRFNEAAQQAKKEAQNISVPSSSGHTFQPISMSRTSTVASKFQSPLHRGTRFNRSGRHPCRSQREHFSPLFIGAHVSTIRSPCRTAACRTAFQSPLHRGTRFNRKVVDIEQVRAEDFSPLFIGAHVSTPAAGWPHVRADAISVPSSSGHTFQPRTMNSKAHMPSRFQSPLHRGTRFNSRSSVTRKRSRFYFSPLFIGAHVSTKKRHGMAGAAGQISVPSSSGHTFQRCRQAERRGCDQDSFQSPLHRGTRFNDAVRDRGQSAQAIFQSPLHRGTRFNRSSGSFIFSNLQEHCSCEISKPAFLLKMPLGLRKIPATKGSFLKRCHRSSF
jgi:hypothetical protein